MLPYYGKSRNRGACSQGVKVHCMKSRMETARKGCGRVCLSQQEHILGQHDLELCQLERPLGHPLLILVGPARLVLCSPSCCICPGSLQMCKSLLDICLKHSKGSYQKQNANLITCLELLLLDLSVRRCVSMHKPHWCQHTQTQCRCTDILDLDTQLCM